MMIADLNCCAGDQEPPGPAPGAEPEQFWGSGHIVRWATLARFARSVFVDLSVGSDMAV